MIHERRNQKILTKLFSHMRGFNGDQSWLRRLKGIELYKE
jgi:hypothetical protein